MHELFDPDELFDLDELMERVSRSGPLLQELMDESQAMLRAGCATDETGSVRVAVDVDGIPESIRLDADWSRRVGPAGLAAAVQQACENARQAGLRASGESGDQEALMARLTELLDYIGGGPEPAGLAPQAAAPEPADLPAWAAPMDTAALADWMGTKSIDELIAAARSQSGTAAYGALVLTVADGALTCALDQDWLRGQSTEEIEAAFELAVASLREARRNALPMVDAPVGLGRRAPV